MVVGGGPAGLEAARVAALRGHEVALFEKEDRLGGLIPIAALPIILSTGFSHLVDADSAKAAGIKAFALKPLTKREIARTIREVLEG